MIYISGPRPGLKCWWPALLLHYAANLLKESAAIYACMQDCVHYEVNGSYFTSTTIQTRKVHTDIGTRVSLLLYK